MNRHKVLAIPLLILLSVACAPKSTPVPAVSAASCQRDVDAMSTLIQDLQLPTHLLQEDGIKTGEEFDVNRYFSILTHLSMPPGYVLDYVYFFATSGGEPLIYTRPIDQAPFQTVAEYKKAGGKVLLGEAQHSFIDSVRVDDTADGFLQFIVLRTMGSQFYQYWHASYYDFRIICDPTGLEALLSQPDEFGQTIPQNVQRAARRLRFEPTVEFADDTVKVQVVIFSKWDGFLRQSYTINREFPHTVLQEDTETLVEYFCGMTY